MSVAASYASAYLNQYLIAWIVLGYTLSFYLFDCLGLAFFIAADFIGSGVEG